MIGKVLRARQTREALFLTYPGAYPTDSPRYAADMDEKQWDVVMRNNDLLNGKFFEGGGTNDRLQVPTSIRRARYTGMSISSWPYAYEILLG
jgi:hypothetical protein